MQEDDEDESMLDENSDDNEYDAIDIVIVYLFENKGRTKGGSDRQLISTRERLVLLFYSFPWYLQYNGNSHRSKLTRFVTKFSSSKPSNPD